MENIHLSKILLYLLGQLDSFLRKLARSTSQQEGTTSQQEDTTSQQEDTTSQQEDTTSQQKDTTSQQEDTTSQQEGTTSQQEDTTSQQEDTTSQQKTTFEVAVVQQVVCWLIRRKSLIVSSNPRLDIKTKI